MPRIIKRAPKTPRKIRDIRPKRQLQRNNEKEKKQDTPNEEDWWFSENDKGDDETSSLRARATVKRLSRKPRSSKNPEPDAEEEIRTRRSRIFATLRCIPWYIYNAIRQTPPQQRRKRLFWVIIVISAWKTIYFADLDQYSPANIESRTKKSSSLSPGAFHSIDDEFSPIRVTTDDVPSSMFGEMRPKMDVGSKSAEKRVTSGIPGSLRNMFLKKDTKAGLEFSSQTSHSGSLSLFPQQKTRSMPESYGLQGDGFGASYRSGNNVQSNAFNQFPSNTINTQKSLGNSPQTQLSWADSQIPKQIPKQNQQQFYRSNQESYGKGEAPGTFGQNLLGHLPSNKMESGTSQFGGMQAQASWADSQPPKQNQQQMFGSYKGTPPKQSQQQFYTSNQESYGKGGAPGTFGQNLLGNSPSNNIESGRSQLGGMQAQASWADSQPPKQTQQQMFGSYKGSPQKQNTQQFYTSNQEAYGKDAAPGTFGQNLLGNTPSNQIETGRSQLGGMQAQASWSDSQPLKQNQQQMFGSHQEAPKDAHRLGGYSHETDQSQGLRGQSLLGNSQPMPGSVQDSKSFETPVKYQQSIVPGSDYGGNSFNLNKGATIQDNDKMPLSSLSEIGNSQYSNSKNSPIKDQFSNSRSLSAVQYDTDRDRKDAWMAEDVPDDMDRSYTSLGGMGLSQKQGNDYQNSKNENQNNQEHNMGVHGSSTGLNCANYGGPALESEYAEIVYWRDIPTDATFASPYYNQQAQESLSSSLWKTKYLTFEMDDAGWNNMRLGLENVILLAHAMGRTLVMPPRRQIAHGLFDKSGSKVVSFSDFYDIEAISAKQKGLNIISMEQFLEREALNGQLKSIDGEAIYPPNNQVKWDNQRLDPLWGYVRDVTKTFKWNPNHCVLAFPASGADDQHLFSMMADVLVGKDGRPFPDYSEYQGRPVNVNAPPVERFREILAGRRKICMYDKIIHDNNPVVHFKADQVDGTRLINNFYAFLWFEDWKHDIWSKRFMRDNLRYNNEIMCLSARIISALRNHARQRSPRNVNGFYDSIHVRRGDFQQQFPETKMAASDWLASMQEHIPPGSTIFIATNERDESFFRPFREVYDVTLLGDFGSMLTDINPNYFPLVEQMVASRGRIFFGTFFSTFSAYIARLRGYYSVKEMQSGYMNGGLKNTYFLPSEWKKEMSLYQAIHKPLYSRDFPVAWRDIDRLELPTPHDSNVQY